ncbi:hypothetical protein TNCV_1188551 [Trichonephila clavipes]|nr:hypothetical protein TNCV_1188551 [Trichonephila clavipes]
MVSGWSNGTPCWVSNTRYTISREERYVNHTNGRSGTKNIRLLPWLARSTNLLPLENVWLIVVKHLARCHTPVAAVEKIRQSVEEAAVSAHAIQSLFDSGV